MITPEQAQFFFSNSEDAVCVISASGELLYGNPSAERLFGLSSDSKVKIWNAIPFVEGNDDLIQLFIDAVMNKIASHEAIVDYWNNEGEIHNLYVRMTCFDKDETVYLIVITDMTKLMKVNTALIRYTSPDIADYALMTKEGQKSGGMIKNVTILMSDLRGFTALSSKFSAEELITVLNHYFEAVVAVIQKYGGTVIEFLGDGIFTVFGAPKDLSDHAVRAVKCAAEMQTAMKDVNCWNRENGFPELEMGIGINTGNCVVGNIGSDKKMKYGCMGYAVNSTGRLESLTVGGQVFITDHTRSLITEELVIVKESSFLPKGSAEELKYYEIGGIGDIRINDEGITWKDGHAEEEYLIYTLEAKSVDDRAHRGRLIRMSVDGKYARLVSEMSFEIKQNIMLRKGDESTYAKVLAKDGDGYIICFTSITQKI